MVDQLRNSLVLGLGTNQLVSWNSDFTGTPNGASDSPSISPDGRFVAYHSFASNIVTNDCDGVSDLFLFDRDNNTTTLLDGDNRLFTPVFSGDGLTLVFQSEASDAVTNDFNNSSDLLAYDLIALPGTGLGGFGATNAIPPFTVQMNLTGGSAQNPAPVLSWPLVSGQSYQVQYKDNVGDAAWQNVNGGIIFIGNTGYINDLSPSQNQRFYRIVLNNN